MSSPPGQPVMLFSVSRFEKAAAQKEETDTNGTRSWSQPNDGLRSRGLEIRGSLLRSSEPNPFSQPVIVIRV